MNNLSIGARVIYWEVGTDIAVAGRLTSIVNMSGNLVRIDDGGPFASAYVFADTQRNRELIELFNKQWNALEQAKANLLALALAAFRQFSTEELAELVENYNHG